MGRETDYKTNPFFNGSAFLFIAGVITLCYAATPCPPLSLLPGTVVDCELPAENRTVNCTDNTTDIRRGTIGKYRCEKDMKFSDNIVKCSCKGKWRGIRMFNDFMSRCNISDYPNTGPQELNLTQSQITQLALPAPEAPNTTDAQEDGVAFHNYYRNIHRSPPVELNKTLTDAAQKWAEHEADEPGLKTQPWSERWYSQNIYRVTGDGIDAPEAVKLAVAAWYQGAYRYNWENPSGQSAFTQLVWKSTTDVGIGVAQRGNRTVVVTNYYPPGNVIVSNGNAGETWAWFRLNVLPPNEVPDNTNPSSTAASATSSPTTAPAAVSASTPATMVTTTPGQLVVNMTTTTPSATTIIN